MDMSTTEITTSEAIEKRVGVSLTQEVAHSIIKSILSGEKYYYSDKNLIILREDNVREGEISRSYSFPRSTYDNWIFRNSIVPETGRTLKSMIEEAREKYAVIKRKKEIKQRVATSEKALDEILALPIHYTSITRRMKRGVNDKMMEVGRETRKDISAPLVHAKTKLLSMALERLDPENYGKTEKTQNTHVVFSLADLRQHREMTKNNDQKI